MTAGSVVPETSRVTDDQFHGAMVAGLGRAERKAGRKGLAFIMDVTTKQLGNIFGGAAPHPKRLWDARCACPTALDDVADLCSQMAIINEGRIVLAGAPGQLLQSLRGRVWRRAVSKAALADYQARLEVISTRLHAGQTVIHVVADTPPEADFEPVEGEVEDLYFATLSGCRRRVAA